MEENDIIKIHQTSPIRGYIPSVGDRVADIFSKDVFDPEVKRIVKNGSAFISGRQVPTGLSLTSIGTRVGPKDVELLKEVGYPILQKTRSGDWIAVPNRDNVFSGVSSQGKTMLRDLIKSQITHNSKTFSDLERAYDDHYESSSSGGDESDFADPSDFVEKYRLHFSDPFKTNAAMVIGQAMGNMPKLTNWPGGVVTLAGKIPPVALGPKWDGNKERGIPFYEIASVDVKMHVLLKHTHWGKYLNEMCSPGNVLSKHARETRKRIKYFLSGSSDPYLRKSQRDALPPRTGTNIRTVQRTRALRMIQIIMNSDGMFAQIYLADPLAGWSWSMFDRFTVRNIELFLRDEFLDGEMQDTSPVTHYELLKQYRGSLKEAVLGGTELPAPNSAIAEPFKAVVSYLNSKRDNSIQWYTAVNVLTQTRGCGTPPALVTLKSKEKFLRTTGEEPKPIPLETIQFIRQTTQSLIGEMPDHAFTGLLTKAAVRVATSACFESTREDGGTIETVRNLTDEGPFGRAVNLIDLNTGKAVGKPMKLGELTEGEYVFWRCLEEVLSTPLERLKEASLVMIREPGKARTVTKARACLKVVLDVINHVCSYPLREGLSSSSSGMGKSHHGWNFFKSFYGAWRSVTFDEISRRASEPVGESFSETRTYRDLFVSCTDYEEATDHLRHDVAAAVADLWMRKCGIPRVLMGVVHATCFSPRTIFFSASGGTKNFGEPSPTLDNPMRRKMVLRRGVLMGDPLTKVVLHLINAGVRRVGDVGKRDSYLLAFPELSCVTQRARELY